MVGRQAQSGGFTEHLVPSNCQFLLLIVSFISHQGLRFKMKWYREVCTTDRKSAKAAKYNKYGLLNSAQLLLTVRASELFQSLLA